MSQPWDRRWGRFGLVAAVAALTVGVALLRVGAAAEVARVIPAPAIDEPANPQATSEVASSPAAASGASKACFSMSTASRSAVSGYAGGAADHRALRDGRHQHDRPRGIGPGHLRSPPDQLWPHPADLFFGRP